MIDKNANERVFKDSCEAAGGWYCTIGNLLSKIAGMQCWIAVPAVLLLRAVRNTVSMKSECACRIERGCAGLYFPRSWYLVKTSNTKKTHTQQVSSRLDSEKCRRSLPRFITPMLWQSEQNMSQWWHSLYVLRHDKITNQRETLHFLCKLIQATIAFSVQVMTFSVLVSIESKYYCLGVGDLRHHQYMFVTTQIYNWLWWGQHCYIIYLLQGALRFKMSRVALSCVTP